MVLHKLKVTQLVNKFLAYHNTRFTTSLQKPHYCREPNARAPLILTLFL